MLPTGPNRAVLAFLNDRGDYMETTTRFYRAHRPDRFQNFFRDDWGDRDDRDDHVETRLNFSENFVTQIIYNHWKMKISEQWQCRTIRDRQLTFENRNVPCLVSLSYD